jgi:hypothetical protein
VKLSGMKVTKKAIAPLAQGLALERNLFLKLCVSEPALAPMRSYEGTNITSPSRSIEVDTRSASRG